MDAQRIGRVRNAMKAAGLRALLLTNPKNVRYVTGARAMMFDMVQPFNDLEYFALVHPDRVDILCDGRYFSGAKAFPGVTPQLLEAPTSAAVIGKKVRELVGEAKCSVGFEEDALIHRDAKELISAIPEYEWRPADQLMARLRVIKTPAECDLIRQAQAITCEAFNHIAGYVQVGMTEQQVAAEIEDYMREHSEGNSFHPIVAFGATGANAHYTPSATRKLEKGQLALVDFGSIYGGYCGDLTRMICMGKPNARQREVYDLVLNAQLACLAAIKPGVTTGSLDAVCRDYFKANNCAEAFIHGTGHGVGLAIHEDPRLKQKFETLVEPGMVFTVEPGLYYEGWGGIRIEDMVIATETGHENITKSSKELVELDV